MWAGHVARMGEERGVYRVFVGKPEGKRPLGRPRHKWVDNIRMDLQEVGCGYMDWIGLAQDKDRWRTFVNAVMNLRVPWNAGNFLTSCNPVSFSRGTLHHGVSKNSVPLNTAREETILIIFWWNVCKLFAHLTYFPHCPCWDVTKYIYFLICNVRIRLGDVSIVSTRTFQYCQVIQNKAL